MTKAATSELDGSKICSGKVEVKDDEGDFVSLTEDYQTRRRMP